MSINIMQPTTQLVEKVACHCNLQVAHMRPPTLRQLAETLMNNILPTTLPESVAQHLSRLHQQDHCIVINSKKKNEEVRKFDIFKMQDLNQPAVGTEQVTDPMPTVPHQQLMSPSPTDQQQTKLTRLTTTKPQLPACRFGGCHVKPSPPHPIPSDPFLNAEATNSGILSLAPPFPSPGRHMWFSSKNTYSTSFHGCQQFLIFLSSSSNCHLTLSLYFILELFHERTIATADEYKHKYTRDGRYPDMISYT